MSEEVGKVSLGLHLNSNPLSRQMKSLQGNLTGEFTALGKKLGAAIGIGLSIKGLVDFGKKAIELGSDLAEVQNVVDTTFGGMSARVNEWASSAITSVGLSEKMAKEFAGFYGAMAKSAGFAGDELYEMSTELTGLAADVASFYNLDPSESYNKLKAVFTGETESLKSIGVMMTQANLDQYALANGFGKTTAAMTEQEKTALRYQYVMSALSDASGDFVRTSDSWANQVRVLKLQFESLSATIGQGLIAALTPAIQALNRFMAALVKAANTFKAFVYSLMGKKSEDMAAGAGAVTDALGGISSGAADASDAISGVGDSTSAAAKEIKRSLAGFDQITKLMDTTASGGGGSSGSGSGGGSGGSASSLGDTASALISEEFDLGTSTFGEQLRAAFDSADWETLGTLLGEKVNEGIAKIPWASLGEKFGKGINGIISTEYWTLDAINFENIGASIATFLNNAIGNIDFDIAGRLPVKKLTAIIDTAIGFLKTLDWGLIARSVSDFIKGAFSEGIDWFQTTDFVTLGEDLYTAISDFLKDVDWLGIAESIDTFLGEALKASAGLLIGFVDGLFDDVIDSLFGENTWTRVKNWFIDGWNGIIDSLKDNRFIVSMADFLDINLDSLKLDPIEIPAKADLTDVNKKNLTADQRTISTWAQYDARKNGKLYDASNKSAREISVWARYDASKRNLSDKARTISTWANFTSYKRNFAEKPWAYADAWFNRTDGNTSGKTGSYYPSKPWAYADAYFNKYWAKSVGGGWMMATVATGGVFAGGKWSPIQRYASGGVPGSGQMFIAREAGPELVGTLGGHTAVMNNDQIVASVSAGVARAIAGIKFYSRERATPQLAFIGSSVSRSEEYLSTMAEQARAEASGGTSAQILSALQTLIALVKAMDRDVYLDGESVKDRVVSLINARTRATGTCEILV